MSRPITVLIEELQSTLAELWHALSPLNLGAAKPRGAKAPPARPAKPAAPGGAASPAAAARKAAPAPTPRRKSSSPKLILQGKYMTAIRKLSKRAKAEVRKVRAEEGVEAAIALALSKKG
ncbi:MAG: hypothetical protein WCH74_11545 [Chloroflexota bacterium]